MKITNRLPSIERREFNVTLPEHALDAIEGARNAASSLANGLTGGDRDQYEASTTPRISSLVDKYKGPDSIELPQRSSRVDQYEGPDSLKRPEIESEVEKYKGPKSLFDERGSRVEKYKGPDSAERQIFIIPDEALDTIAAIRNAASSFSLIKDYEDKIKNPPE